MTFEEIIYNVIFFLVVYILVFLVDYFILSKEGKGKKRTSKLTNIDIMMIKKYNLDDRKINLTSLNFHIALINAFIISFVSVVICLTNFFITIQLLIGFVMLFFLTYALYELYGRHLKRKYSKKE